MKFLLDTNVCITHLRGKNTLLSTRFGLHPPSDIVVCSVVRAELYHGVAKSRNAANRAHVGAFVTVFPTLAFDDRAAKIYGHLRYDRESRGLPIGANDLLIAAIALSSNLTLVTHNTAEFGRVTGLTLVDWEVP